MTSNRTIIDFLIYSITEQEKRAIQVVNLFLNLVDPVARRRGVDHVIVQVAKLHHYFPEFAQKLGLETFGEEAKLYQHTWDQSSCPAVTMRERVYAEEGMMRMSYVFYIHSSPAARPVLTTGEEIMNHTRRIGSRLEWEKLLELSDHTLKKMGSII